MYSKDIANAVIEYLKEKEWNYKFDEQTGVIKTGIQLDEKINSCTLHIFIHDHYVINYGIIELSVDEKNRILISEFLTRANYGLIWGNFEMDFNDGEIRYKSTLGCDGIIPTNELIDRMVMTPAFVFKRYADGLVKVLFGLSTPKDAVEECEKNSKLE